MKAIEFAALSGRKVYLEGPGGMRVPQREIALTPPHPPLRVYDTSGPYSDPAHSVDLERGLPRLREAWIRSRGDVEAGSARAVRARPGRGLTQLHHARRGE